MEATHVNVGSVTSAEGNDAKEQPKKKKLLQHQSMLIGTSEESVGKVSCNFFVFLKQFIYHLLPPFVNCLLCRVLEGSQGATNQAMWSPSSSAISAFFWYFTRCTEALPYLVLIFHYSGNAVSPTECGIMVAVWLSRALMIGVKYSLRPTSALKKFHAIRDKVEATNEMNKNLLASWIHPSRSHVIDVVHAAAEYASLKSSIDWYTKGAKLSLPVIFVGKERCRKVLDYLHVQKSGNVNAEVCNKLDLDQHLETRFGPVEGATRRDGKGCRRLSGVDVSACATTTIAASTTSASEQEMRSFSVKITHLKVPTGTLLTALIMNVSKANRSLQSLISKISLVLIFFVVLLPLVTRAITLYYVPNATDPFTNSTISLILNIENPSMAWIGMASYMLASLGNGYAMMLFLFCSVVDYKRRSDTLCATRNMMRSSQEVRLHDGACVRSPPLVDLRMNDNVFGMCLVKDTLLFFGKEYLLRLQFLLSYLILVILLLTVRSLYLIFAVPTVESEDTIPPYLEEGTIVGLFLTLFLSGVIIAALYYADLANLEPEYFMQSMWSQGMGMHSDIKVMSNKVIEAKTELEQLISGADPSLMVYDANIGYVRKHSMGVYGGGESQAGMVVGEVGEVEEVMHSCGS